MKFFKFLFLVIVLGSLTACPLKTRDEIQQQDEEKNLKDTVSSIQRQRADNEQRYSDLQGDMRVIAGRVDALEHNRQTSDQNLRMQIDNLKKMVQDQADKLHLLEQHMDATETRLTAAIQAIASNPSTNTSGATTKEPAVGVSKKESGGNYDEAEGLFANKEFKKAIIKYQAYRDKNPHGSKAADATYKIGVCFAELGLKKDARDFYQETIDSFPGTPQAKKAKKRMAQMK